MIAPKRARIMMVMRKVIMEAKTTFVDSATKIKWFMSVLIMRKLDLMLQTYFGQRGRW